MSVIKYLNLSSFLDLMGQIDKESIQKRSASPDTKVIVVLISAAFCLLFIDYCKSNTVFWSTQVYVSNLMYGNDYELTTALKKQVFYPMYGLIWWSFIQVIGFLLVPYLIIKLVFKENLTEYGMQFGRVREHTIWYVLLAAPIVIFAFLASFREDFANHYPFYRLASRSWVDFILWEFTYIVQFIVLEFFFRGYMLQSTKHRFGSSAILVMCLPYLMIHFGKPWLEATGAIFFGLFLGLLAMRSRSIWGGVAVHVTIALSMDVFALIQTRGLPDQFMP